ncbi:MAG: Maf family protein [Nitrospinaceae bacterium]
MPSVPHASCRLILASRSPRRIDLLREAGLDFEVLPADIDETTDPEQSAEENVRSLALLKAAAVAHNRPGRFILAADTLVVLDSKIIGKPRDREDARRILRALSGRTHRVITGLALIAPGGAPRAEAVASQVDIKPLTGEVIEAYLDTGEPMDKAGAYAIQGHGAALVAAHRGSYTNIVGLPMERVLVLLTQAGHPTPPG